VSDTVICVENLSKQYILYHQQTARYQTLKDSVAHHLKVWGDRLRPTRSFHTKAVEQEEFWALKDVSFEVKQGDRVGIIGRNGAGKSTLLKILSRITEPTHGRIAMKGRVASLLEVGTGFHPELSGRENIFLNGAILGMSRSEIKKKFDEIVAFAEVERFLDTPVKRYSSGMYVRLAFAVAAHLEPEILIVDEVLAVGDIQFQKKCLGKMKEVGQQGRTIFFVSHNMQAIQALCERCLLLKEGRLVADQLVIDAVQNYLQISSTSNSFIRPQQLEGKPTIVSGKLSFVGEQIASTIQIDLQIFSTQSKEVSLELRLADATGNGIGFGALGTFDPTEMLKLQPGLNQVALTFSTQQLANGNYFVHLDLTMPFKEYYDRVENCFLFEIIRPLGKQQIATMMQAWGYGSFEIPLNALNVGA
jgi:lipopolysaccharide transport system ATP-binding protein